MSSPTDIRPLAIAAAIAFCTLSVDAFATSNSGTFYCIGYAGSTQANNIDTADQYGVVTAQIFNPHGSRPVTIDEVRVMNTAGNRLETIPAGTLPKVPKRGIGLVFTERTGFATTTPGLVTIMVEWSQSRRNTTRPVARVQNSLYDVNGVYLGATVNDCVSM